MIRFRTETRIRRLSRLFVRQGNSFRFRQFSYRVSAFVPPELPGTVSAPSKLPGTVSTPSELQVGGICYVGGSDTLPPPLTREREAELVARMTEEPARQELIEHNLRLVVYIARRFDNTGINLEDLISIGTIGLIKAVGTYRADKNIKLATYASRCIENEILMYLRKNAARKGEVSFDEPLNTDWDGNELLLSDVLGTDPDIVMRPIEEDVDRRLLFQAISLLPPRERQIITLRFGLGGGPERTQKEVADALGISQSYISRLEKRIIQRLKKEILRLS